MQLIKRLLTRPPEEQDPATEDTAAVPAALPALFDQLRVSLLDMKIAEQQARDAADQRLADLDTSIADARARVEADQLELLDLADALAGAEAARQVAEAAVDEARTGHDAAVAAYELQLKTAAESRATLESQLAGMRTNLDGVRTELRDSRRRASQVEIQLNQECAAHAATQATLDAASRAHDDAVSELRTQLATHEQAAAESKAALAQLQRELDDSRSELARQRELVGRQLAELAAQRTALVAARAAEQEAVRGRAEIAGNQQAQLESLQRDRDEAHAEIERLRQERDRMSAEAASLQDVIRAVHRVVMSGQDEGAAAGAPDDVSESVTQPAHDARESVSPMLLSSDTPSGASTDSALSTDKAAAVQAVSEEAAVAEYAKQLLGAVRVMFDADMADGHPRAAVCERLTAHLRYARDAFARRVGGAADLEVLFRQCVMTGLDEQSEFGRYLGFAVYDVFPVAPASPDNPHVKPTAA